MKKFAVGIIALTAFVGTTAAAADLDTVVKAPPLAPVRLYSWTGFYVGGQVGYGWGSSSQCFSCGSAAGGQTSSYNMDGIVGGATAGFNWQFNPSFVVGIETDLSGANIKGTGTTSLTYSCSNNLGMTACNTNVTSFGTVRGRLGFVANNALFYGTGGWAYGRAEADIDNCLGNAAGNCGSRQVSGWTAGAGVEYAFMPNWSAKIEYLRVNLGNFVFSNVGGCTGLQCTSSANFNVVRGGLNYRFNWGH